MKKLNNPFLKNKQYNCFGCAPANDAGLKLQFMYKDENVIAEWSPSKQFAGYNDVLHGGIQAALADETAAWLVMVVLGTSGMTNELKVKYHKPLFVTADKITIKAELESQSKKNANVKVSLINESGQLCSEAFVSFTVFPEMIARKKFMFPGKEAFF